MKNRGALSFRANSIHELNSLLSSSDISVPPRDQKRTTEDCERWSVYRFLSALNSARMLDFPLRLTKRERPDFEVQFSGESWGVEITEAVSQSYAHAVYLTVKEHPEAVIDLSLFPFDSDLSLSTIRNIINASKLTGSGWAGDQPERRFAEAVGEIVRSKTLKLLEEDFSKFERNLLVIYENLPLPSLSIETSKQYISEALAQYWIENRSFDSVYIETGETMLICDISGCESIGIPNL